MRFGFGLLFLVLAAGCHTTPKSNEAKPATTSTSKDAEAQPSQPSVIAAKGTPFIVAVEHAIENGVWLSNGHLVGASHTELFDLDPATNLVRRAISAKPIRYLVGSRGSTYVAASHEDDEVSIWDAVAFKHVRTIPNVSMPRVAGDRLVVVLPPTGNGGYVHESYDLASGKALAKITPPNGPDFRGDITLSENGRWAYVHNGNKAIVADLETGKTLVQRRLRRVMEPEGVSFEFADFRGDNVILTSDQGLESIALPSGKASKIPDPLKGMITAAVDLEGTRVALYSSLDKKIITWDLTTKKTTTESVELSDSCAANPLGAKANMECGDQRAPSKRFELQLKPTCRLVDRESRQTLIEHDALCGTNPFTSDAPGFRKDDRFYASVFEGGAHIFDLTNGGKRVAGIGPLPSQSLEHQRPLVVTDGIATIGPTPQGKRFALTKKTPPTEAPRPAGFRSVVVTRTHSFGVQQAPQKGPRVIVALDRSGKEVLRQTLPPFDEMLQASEHIALLRIAPNTNTSKNDYFQCDVTAPPCKEINLGGYITSFEYPWVVTAPRADSQPGRQPEVLNLVTQAKLPLAAACKGNADSATVFGDKKPTTICVASPQTSLTLAPPDGSATKIPLPPGAPTNTHLLSGTNSFSYFAGVVNAGLSPGYRLDLRTNERVDLFLGNDHAIARFADGKIERFGDRERTEEAVRCLDGDQLLPWSACSAAYEVDGRLDATNR